MRLLVVGELGDLTALRLATVHSNSRTLPPGPLDKPGELLGAPNSGSGKFSMPCSVQLTRET